MLSPLPAIADNAAALARVLDHPALSATIRTGTDVIHSTVRTTASKRAHLLNPAGTRFDPRITTETVSGALTHRADNAVRADLHVLNLSRLDGVASLDDAERAVTRLVLDDGLARGVLQPGDGFYTGTVHSLQGGAFTDAQGAVRYVRSGTSGFAQSNLGVPQSVLPGNAPTTVQPGIVRTLDLQDNVVDSARTVQSTRFASGGQDWTPSLAANGVADIEYAARLGELKSVIGRDGILRFAGS